MVTAERLAQRRAEIARSADLQALLAHLAERAAPLLAHAPVVPSVKAFVSSDGGVCAVDGVRLEFDPWSPSAHRCPRCGKSYVGERHDRDWARRQHLWLAERAAHLAALAALGEDAQAAGRAGEILEMYATRYFSYPNRDNELGPSRLFFSTYLESLWIANYLAAAVLLREAGRLAAGAARGVAQLADEAANLIGDYDEGFSNRQTWNNAALAAIAAWFEDEALAERAIQGPTGLVAHLVRGFGDDGMWYEGENYHLFALRGLLVGAQWAREAGVELAANPALAVRLEAALLALERSALPDFTMPARKDSRWGMSLAQPMHLEALEVGRAALASGAEGPASGARVARWLAALYAAPALAAEVFDAYLHDAPAADPPCARPPSRRALSWWALVFMPPEAPSDRTAWVPTSGLVESQGLAVLRGNGRYVSLECGPSGGGHGHPDRLHVTLHAEGVGWLTDPGTGSYHTRDLLWYRSTLAHNAPRLDGVSQPLGDATCEMFDAPGEWAWARGRYGEVTRTVVAGPAYVVDVVELASRGEHLLEVPWHFRGPATLVAPSQVAWSAGELADEFVSGIARCTPVASEPFVLGAGAGGRVLRAVLLGAAELVRADGPGLPDDGARQGFFLARARGRGARLVTVLEPTGERPAVREVRVQGGVIEVVTMSGVDRHSATATGWEIATPSGRVRLAGARAPEPRPGPLVELDRPRPSTGVALRVSDAPPLDGTLAGFDESAPLTLELEDQYRRSEEPYPGPEELSAVATAAWDDAALYLAVAVTKPELCFRPPNAPPLGFGNEPDDIHSDGLQVYLRDLERATTVGFLIVPEGDQRGRLRVRGAGEAPGAPAIVWGAWRRTPSGFCVTLAIGWPEGYRPHVGGTIGFDLIINEMLPGRERRAGQLVWSGGNGWVWLRSDRQDPERFGVLELVA